MKKISPFYEMAIYSSWETTFLWIKNILDVTKYLYVSVITYALLFN